MRNNEKHRFCRYFGGANFNRNVLAPFFLYVIHFFGGLFSQASSAKGFFLFQKELRVSSASGFFWYSVAPIYDWCNRAAIQFIESQRRKGI